MADEIIIKVKRRRRNRTLDSPLSTLHSLSGILRPRSESEYQARRLNADARLNFWDLNQRLADGIFTDRVFSADSPLPAGAVRSFMNEVLSDPVENWKNIYRKIEPADAHKYRFSLFLDGEYRLMRLGATPNFTAKGLRLTDDLTEFNLLGGEAGAENQKFVFYGAEVTQGLFPSFTTGGGVRVTESRDPLAPNIPFIIPKGASAEVFLNTNVFTVAASQTVFETPSGSTSVSDLDPFEVGWVRSGESGPPFQEPARERRTSAYLSALRKYFNFPGGYGGSTYTGRYTNWKRTQVLPLYAEAELLRSSFDAAKSLLFNEENFPVVDLTIDNYGQERYFALHTFVDATLYPQLYGSWRGLSGALPTTINGAISGTRSTAPGGLFTLSEPDFFSSQTYLEFNCLLAVVAIKDGATLYLWSRPFGGGG